jgi:hypothetical protein
MCRKRETRIFKTDRDIKEVRPMISDIIQTVKTLEDELEKLKEYL